MQKITTIISFILMLSVGIATPPLQPPTHKYFVSGYIMCDSINNLSDFAVQMYVKKDSLINEYSPILYHPDNFENHTIDLTDSSGFFNIVTTSWTYYDSIKIGIVSNGEKTILSESFGIDKQARREITKMFDAIDMNGSGCNSCSVDAKEERVIRYEYNLHGITFKFCD